MTGVRWKHAYRHRLGQLTVPTVPSQHTRLQDSLQDNLAAVRIFSPPEPLPSTCPSLR
jgi:hypothetical protein